MQNETLIPRHIDDFFIKVYKEKPTVSSDKKGTRYTICDPSINIEFDRYRGCHINITTFPKDRVELIKEAIKELVDSFHEIKAFNSVWLNAPLPCHLSTIGMIAPDSFIVGTPGKCDLIYDHQENKMRLWSWINEDKICTIPPGATHNIGGAALIIDKIAEKVLLVVSIDRKHSWNLPGGSFDPRCDQSPSYTALRRAQEEGGFQIEENHDLQPCLIGQMQFPKNQFASAINQIWAFFLDNISSKELHPPQDEIARAEWISFGEITQSNGRLKGLNLGLEIKKGLEAAIKGRGCQEIMKKDWMVVHV